MRAYRAQPVEIASLKPQAPGRIRFEAMVSFNSRFYFDEEQLSRIKSDDVATSWNIVDVLE